MSTSAIVVQEYASHADAVNFRNCLGAQSLGNYNGVNALRSAPLNLNTAALRVLVSPEERIREEVANLECKLTDGTVAPINVDGVTILDTPPGTGSGVVVGVGLA